jgi:hypothetical protein
VCPLDLKALNEKYPTCSTCIHRGERKLRKGAESMCLKHKRPIEYVWHTDEKGRKSVVIDVPCADYQYLDTPTPLTLSFRQLRSK